MTSCDEKNMRSILLSGYTTKSLEEESKFHQELNLTLTNPDRQHSRTQTRITLNHLQGRPLTQSHNTQELLTSLKQVIQAQRTVYLQHGTLHRDISISNILILSTNPPPTSSKSQNQIITEAQTQPEAALIDFDHYQPLDLIPSLLGAVHALPFSDPNAIEPPWKYAKEYLELRHPDLPPLDEDVERLLGMYLADGWEIKRLIGMKLGRGGHCSEDKITLNMLGLLPKDQFIPNPNAPHPPSYRSPTLPFSSCELLTRRRVHYNKKPRPPLPHASNPPSFPSGLPVEKHTWESWVAVLEDPDSELYSHHWRSEGGGHDVVHEAESLFWIFTWVCLARSGASDEGDSELSFKRESLRKKLFDSTQHSPVTLGLEKSKVITGETSSSQSPMKYFSTNFNGEEVIELWKGWRRLIGLGYEMVMFEDVLLGMERVVDNVMEEGN